MRIILLLLRPKLFCSNVLQSSSENFNTFAIRHWLVEVQYLNIQLWRGSNLDRHALQLDVLLQISPKWINGEYVAVIFLHLLCSQPPTFFSKETWTPIPCKSFRKVYSLENMLNIISCPVQRRVGLRMFGYIYKNFSLWENFGHNPKGS